MQLSTAHLCIFTNQPSFPAPCGLDHPRLFLEGFSASGRKQAYSALQGVPGAAIAAPGICRS
eukprot:365252-Chlamydomonas_euryale.AAC.55